jgi:hypothetical protein
MQIDGFIEKDEFKKQIDEWIKVFRNTKPAPGTNGPLIPGDPEREAEAIRSKEGISFDQAGGGRLAGERQELNLRPVRYLCQFGYQTFNCLCESFCIGDLLYGILPRKFRDFGVVRHFSGSPSIF